MSSPLHEKIAGALVAALEEMQAAQPNKVISVHAIVANYGRQPEVKVQLYVENRISFETFATVEGAIEAVKKLPTDAETRAARVAALKAELNELEGAA
jgi:hypothetical protein